MNGASAVVWRRLGYMLTPQLDIYMHLADRLIEKRVLEVGFGTGVGVLQYASKANGVTAIEIDPAAVEFAQKVFPIKGIEWEHGDITDYKTQKQFRAVIMVEVLEHIPDWEVALQKVHDLLFPGGHLYLSHRNANADLRKNDLHEREWTATEVKENLGCFFSKVWLYDYALMDEQTADTRVTPIVAVAEK
jgi:2-polyprenyl-3-methyl-5-hydroxy-6-metoxy-1,4-benzoquinol methylase